MALQRLVTEDKILEFIQDAVSDEIERLEDKPTTPWGIPTDIKYDAYQVRFGDLVRCDATGGAFTVTLPSLAVNNIGERVTVKKITTSNAVTVRVANTDTETIDGATTFALADTTRESVTLVCASTTIWDVICEGGS